MRQYRVGLTCNDPRVLPELASRLKEPWSTIVEIENTYYWSSSLFEGLATVAEVDQCAARLLPTLNGLVNLHFMSVGELTKAGRIKFIDDQGRELTQVTLSTQARVVFAIHEDEPSQRETRQRWLQIAEISLKENEDSPISQALNYFGKEANWDNLFKVYEVILKDYNNSQGIVRPGNFASLPEDWTKDETGRNREQDFTESANNAYVSGIFARHSWAQSRKVAPVANSPLWKLSYKDLEILPMSLEKAKTFIANLLSHWLIKKAAVTTSSSETSDSMNVSA